MRHAPVSCNPTIIP
ncbi:hypothetical protein SAMN04487915_104119 [Arthrobacter sp. ov118]|nr:hypothetical protein SAMN04487915_104119 [Arthrobacter sp. ov118]